jgi:hypothetical protein
MKTLKELREAIASGKNLVWKDPNAIPGNDYNISYIEPVKHYFDKETPIVIRYNKGLSEAEVLVSEIDIKP